MYSLLDWHSAPRKSERRNGWFSRRSLARLSFGVLLSMTPLLAFSVETTTSPGSNPGSSSEASQKSQEINRKLPSGPDVALSTNPGTDLSTLPIQGQSTKEIAFSEVLLIPVTGISYSQLQDTFSDGRSSGRIHDAIDIMAPERTPVVAVADGTIAHLCRRGRGGLSIYQFDDTGHFVYFYAHLHSYSKSLVTGKKIRRGEIIGYVGHSGNARAGAPHLHFAIASLGNKSNWWGGEAINPYTHFQR